MASIQLKGIRFLDGTKEGFDIASIENGILCSDGDKCANEYTNEQIDDKLDK